MPRVYRKRDGVSCRACGATKARGDDNKFGICATCYRRFSWHNNPESDEDFLAWLARTLELHLHKFKRIGNVNRCEAITGQGSYLWRDDNRGFQCGARAVARRNGHWVCSRHEAAIDPVYVDDGTTDSYIIMRDLIAELCAIDDKFYSAVEDALSLAKKALST